MATLIVGLIVAAVIFLIAKQLYKDKKFRKSSCGGNCMSCLNSCACHNDCHGDVAKLSLIHI